MISLGATYVDRITGFKGVATGHCTYLTGCSQTLLNPKVGTDGAAKDSQWYDDQRLEVQEEAVISLDNSKTPGCDKAAPKR